MSKGLPYFKFFPSEWLLEKISNESNSVQGAFIRVCAIYWQRECDLNINEIKSKVGQKLISLLSERNYIKCEGECVRINFLDEQWEELMGTHTRNVQNGKDGATKRWANRDTIAEP